MINSISKRTNLSKSEIISRGIEYCYNNDTFTNVNSNATTNAENIYTSLTNRINELETKFREIESNATTNATSNTLSSANNVPVEQQYFKTKQSPEILDCIEGFKGVPTTISDTNTSKDKQSPIDSSYKPTLNLVWKRGYVKQLHKYLSHLLNGKGKKTKGNHKWNENTVEKELRPAKISKINDCSELISMINKVFPILNITCQEIIDVFKTF